MGVEGTEGAGFPGEGAAGMPPGRRSAGSRGCRWGARHPRAQGGCSGMRGMVRGVQEPSLQGPACCSAGAGVPGDDPRRAPGFNSAAGRAAGDARTERLPRYLGACAPYPGMVTPGCFLCPKSLALCSSPLCRGQDVVFNLAGRAHVRCPVPAGPHCPENIP